jgi:hypothetical protein
VIRLYNLEKKFAADLLQMQQRAIAATMFDCGSRQTQRGGEVN